MCSTPQNITRKYRLSAHSAHHPSKSTEPQSLAALDLLFPGFYGLLGPAASRPGLLERPPNGRLPVGFDSHFRRFSRHPVPLELAMFFLVVFQCLTWPSAR